MSTDIDPATGEKIRPPYTPYLTLKNFIGKMKQDGVPHRVDKSVMSTLSGASQSHVLLAMRYLGLIEDNGTPTTTLHDLVKTYDTASWPADIAGLIGIAYEKVIDGLDLMKSTPAQLEEAFRLKGGTEGTVTDKAIRFYLRAMDDANIKYSKHFNKARGPRPGSRRKRQGQEDGSGSNAGGGPAHVQLSSEDQVPEGMISFPIHLPGKPMGRIIVPSDFDEDDAAMVDAAMAYLKLYAKKNAGKGKGKGELK